ncbi:phosphate/phosphite/phosphonate ABC transporter substrate-binding protein [Synechococcus sp. PCC 7336]|uniref:phosphate/phosphite/phosphonate ABC transporter substrate-binding protein n=1 Tax=Synechococcus sp. PCC 7336 TaxID=195250 RepID=UPI00034C3964|nr:PhnD/SsuA/transferrin family substrate-binding protein [Synechococcus sp. PCC 7336]
MRVCRVVVLLIAALLVGCAASAPVPVNRLIVGVVAYGEGSQSLDRYESFRDYLALQTHSVVELEPAFNEVKALEEIRRRHWSLVFAPPGLAAVAIAQAQYSSLFPLQGRSSNVVRSVLVVREDSPIEAIADLKGQAVALGQPGSATGYYLPLYDMFGLTLAEVSLEPTPRQVLMAIHTGEAAAGALAKSEFERYRGEFDGAQFRTIHTSRSLPAGVVAIGPAVELNLQEIVRQAMNDAPPQIASEVGFIPNADPPDYRFFIDLIAKVAPLEVRLNEVPVALYPPAIEVESPPVETVEPELEVVGDRP